MKSPGFAGFGFVESVRTVAAHRLARRLARREFAQLSEPARGMLEWMRGGKLGSLVGSAAELRAQAWELRARLLTDAVVGSLEATPWGHFVGAVGAEEDDA